MILVSDTLLLMVNLKENFFFSASSGPRHVMHARTAWGQALQRPRYATGELWPPTLRRTHDSANRLSLKSLSKFEIKLTGQIKILVFKFMFFLSFLAVGQITCPGVTLFGWRHRRQNPGTNWTSHVRRGLVPLHAVITVIRGFVSGYPSRREQFVR